MNSHFSVFTWQTAGRSSSSSWPYPVTKLACHRHGKSLPSVSPKRLGIPLNTPSTSDFALAGKPSPGNHDRSESSQTPAKAKPQHKTPKRQNLHERRTASLGAATRRALAWVRHKATDFRRDCWRSPANARSDQRASEVLSCTFSIQMVGKMQTKFTTLAQQISYQSWNPLRKTSLPRFNPSLQFSNGSTRKYQCIVPPFLWA